MVRVTRKPVGDVLFTPGETPANVDPDGSCRFERMTAQRSCENSGLLV
jgi:hypothetical protein